MSTLSSAGLPYAESCLADSAALPANALNVAIQPCSGLPSYEKVELATLSDRWRQQKYTIADSEFGIGKNFLTTAEQWINSNNGEWLHYIGATEQPNHPNDILAAAESQPSLLPLAKALIKLYPPPLRGWHRMQFPQWRITLDLLLGDDSALHEKNGGVINAWFAQEPPTTAIRHSNGQVKRATPATAIVLGAGLAGSAAAAALARQGARVTVFEERKRIASAASGNPVAVLQGRYHRKQDHLGRWAQTATRHTLTEIDSLNRAGFMVEQLGCGSLHMLKDFDEQKALSEQLALPSTVGEWLSPEAATLRAGTAIPRPALWQAEARVVNPSSLTAARLASSPNITTQCSQRITSLHKTNDKWRAFNAAGELAATADIVVLATGAATHYWLPWLPLQLARGQLTAVPATDNPPKTIIGYGGQLMPPINPSANQPKIWLGATAARQPLNSDVLDEEHHTNLQRLQGAMPELHATLNTEQTTGRAAIRCKYLDHLPLAGHVGEGIYLSVAHGARGLSNSSLCGEIVASHACSTHLPLSISSAADPLRAWHRAQQKTPDLVGTTPFSNTPIQLQLEENEE